jgi:hypothetical protein
MADETKQVSVIMGPYQSARLTMTTADADAAINAHWARDPNEPYGEHDPLSAEEREAALTAARDWAHLQWEHAGNPPPAPPEGGDVRRKTTRDMKPADNPDTYKTRGT